MRVNCVMLYVLQFVVSMGWTQGVSSLSADMTRHCIRVAYERDPWGRDAWNGLSSSVRLRAAPSPPFQAACLSAGDGSGNESIKAPKTGASSTAHTWHSCPKPDTSADHSHGQRACLQQSVHKASGTPSSTASARATRSRSQHRPGLSPPRPTPTVRWRTYATESRKASLTAATNTTVSAMLTERYTKSFEARCALTSMPRPEFLPVDQQHSLTWSPRGARSPLQG